MSKDTEIWTKEDINIHFTVQVYQKEIEVMRQKIGNIRKSCPHNHTELGFQIDTEGNRDTYCLVCGAMCPFNGDWEKQWRHR